jgi:hypothetical protein
VEVDFDMDLLRRWRHQKHSGRQRLERVLRAGERRMRGRSFWPQCKKEAEFGPARAIKERNWAGKGRERRERILEPEKVAESPNPWFAVEQSFRVKGFLLLAVVAASFVR